MRVTVDCLYCHHTKTLDLQALSEEYGPETQAMAPPRGTNAL